MTAHEIHPLLGASDIKALLAEHGLAPTKKRGQNFVTDPNTVTRIVRDAGVNPGDLVVEVGPGLGSLTLALLHGQARVVAVELDHGLANAVTALTQGGPIEVVCADATKVRWAELTQGQPAKMVANLPYNVATPIVMQALKEGHLIGYHVMVQKEVGQRWCAQVGDADLGAVSIKMALFGQARIAGTVARQAFFPVPNVDSVTVAITPYQHSVTTPHPDLPPSPLRGPHGTAPTLDMLRVTCDLVDTGFAQRRKTLRNALAVHGRKPGEVDEALHEIDLPIGIRAELLTPQNWLDLANVFYRDNWC